MAQWARIPGKALEPDSVLGSLLLLNDCIDANGLVPSDDFATLDTEMFNQTVVGGVWTWMDDNGEE